jgi:hypothetical protein
MLVGFVCLLMSTTAAPAHAGWQWATGPSVYDQEGKRSWSVAITPYLWLSSLDGSVGLPAIGTIPVSSTFDSLASNLDAGIAGVLDLRIRRWHLISDNSWVQLKSVTTPSQALLTSATVVSSSAFGTEALAYELPLKQGFAVDAYLAARWWRIANEAEVDTAVPNVRWAGSLKETWVDAIVGTRVRYRITEQWRVVAAADIGGGNASLDWSVLGSVGYDFNDWIGASVGYRVMGVDYASAGFAFDVKQSGLLLGLNLRY